MKVIGVVGSPRIGGNTEQLTEEALRIIQEEGIDTELIRLAERKVVPCTVCGACEGEETCPLDDDLLPLYQRLKEADGIILASPVFSRTSWIEQVISPTTMATHLLAKQVARWLLPGATGATTQIPN